MNLKNFAAMHGVSEEEAVQLMAEFEEWDTLQDEREYQEMMGDNT